MSNSGQIGASDAAAFLKKSGLKEGILHQVSITVFHCYLFYVVEAAFMVHLL